jgi:hypothetical protein
MSSRTRAAATLGALALASLQPDLAHAHHPSGVANTGGAGPINTISATTLERDASSVSVMFEATKFAAFSDTQLADFAGRHIHAHSIDAILMPSLSYAYGLTNDLTVSLRLPYVIRTDIRAGEHAHGHGGIISNTAEAFGDADGLGDLTALAQWRILNNPATRTEWAVLFGVKAPTGATDRTGAGELLETEFQPGSGSWDGLIGLAATQRFNGWALDASALYTLGTRGAQDTDLGDRLQYGIAVSWRMLGEAHAAERMHAGVYVPTHGRTDASHDTHVHPAPPRGPSGPALDLVLELNGEWHAHQTIAGVQDANSGGHVLYLAPGLRLSAQSWSGFVSVGVPVVNDLNGVQAEADWRVVTGVSVGF